MTSKIEAEKKLEDELVKAGFSDTRTPTHGNGGPTTQILCDRWEIAHPSDSNIFSRTVLKLPDEHNRSSAHRAVGCRDPAYRSSAGNVLP